ncbi:MAG: hypothetical protein ACE5Q6_26215, partial [Dehalococcoidia bacterium]
WGFAGGAAYVVTGICGGVSLVLAYASFRLVDPEKGEVGLSLLAGYGRASLIWFVALIIYITLNVALISYIASELPTAAKLYFSQGLIKDSVIYAIIALLWVVLHFRWGIIAPKQGEEHWSGHVVIFAGWTLLGGISAVAALYLDHLTLQQAETFAGHPIHQYITDSERFLILRAHILFRDWVLLVPLVIAFWIWTLVHLLGNRADTTQ